MDELRKEYQIEVQAKLKRELFNLAPEEKSPKKEGADKTEEEKKKKAISIMDILNLGNENKVMPPAFQNRLNDFNVTMLEENRMLNSKINAVKLNMEHQSVIAKKLMTEFRHSQGSLNEQIEQFEELIDERSYASQNSRKS